MLIYPMYTILSFCVLLAVFQESHGKKAIEGSELKLGSKTFKSRMLSSKLRKPGKSGLKYCGSQEIPPLKDLVCKDYCAEGECRDFYCECQSDASLKEACVEAEDTSKCAGICKKGNFSKSYHCAKRQLQQCVLRHCRTETSEYHCFCT